MIFRLYLACFIFLLLAESIYTQDVPSKRLLFLNFANTSESADIDWARRSVPEGLNEMSQEKYIYERISDEEWRSSEQGETWEGNQYKDKDAMRNLALAVNASGVVYGQVYKFQRDKQDFLFVEGVVFDVSRNQILGRESFESPINQELFQKIEQIVESLGEIVKELFIPSDIKALWRSALWPGWGQHYKSRYLTSQIYSYSFAGAALFASTFSLLTIQQNNELETVREDEFNETFDRAELYSDIASVAWVSVGLIYVLSLFDAYFIDNEYTYLYLKGQPQPKGTHLNIGFSYAWNDF